MNEATVEQLRYHKMLREEIERLEMAAKESAALDAYDDAKTGLEKAAVIIRYGWFGR